MFWVLIETFLLITHNICFGREIRKVIYLVHTLNLRPAIHISSRLAFSYYWVFKLLFILGEELMLFNWPHFNLAWDLRTLVWIVCQFINVFKHLLKPLGQFSTNFRWILLMKQEIRFVQMILVTWLKMAGMHLCCKSPLKVFYSETEGWWPKDLVCRIGVVGPTKFVQTMTLGWPWPT